uniref:Uncharacterized protein n=1 Tax=Oryza nivara TaxID=4536 RepID=A0A0E0J1G6_ORYNI
MPSGPARPPPRSSVPQRLYTLGLGFGDIPRDILGELQFNGIDTAAFLTPVDLNLGVRRPNGQTLTTAARKIISRCINMGNLA